MIEGKTQVEEKSCKKINTYNNNNNNNNNKMMHVSASIVVVLEHVPLCLRNHNYFR